VVRLFVCLSSVTLVHPAEAVGQNEMLFGRVTDVVPSNIAWEGEIGDRYRSTRNEDKPADRPRRCRLIPNYFDPCQHHHYHHHHHHHHLLLERKTGYHLLNTATKRLPDVSVPGNLVEVSVTSKEKVKGQGQLLEGAFSRSINCRLSIKLKDSFATVTPHVSKVPLIQRYRS